MSIRRLIGLLIIIGILILILTSYLYYIWYAKNTLNAPEGEKVELYIPTGISLQEFYSLLYDSDIIINQDDIELFTIIKKIKKVKSGRYILESPMTCNEVINTFKGGLQTPIRVAITPSRLPADLAQKLANKLELDSSTIHQALISDSIAAIYGFDSADLYTMFIPDTYELYWNSSIESLFKRMKREYDSFWNASRKKKASDIDLTPREVLVLASIVYAEQSQFADERPIIAGLYLNRLQIGMLLQSDPTLIYGLGDFSRKRVLNADKQVDSPYNTYKYAGLPPGPIYSPDKSSIEAVLNADDNKYLYMCAKADFSGYHAFATNLRQHNNNARKYQLALNTARIYH
jgi:UPF0755 protein